MRLGRGCLGTSGTHWVLLVHGIGDHRVICCTRLGFGGRSRRLLSEDRVGTEPSQAVERVVNGLPGLESQLRNSLATFGKLFLCSEPFLICRIVGMVIIPTSSACYESKRDFLFNMHLWVF